MYSFFKNYACYFMVIIYFSIQVSARPESQIEEKADLIFDAVKETVSGVAGAAQDVVGRVIDAAKTGVVNEVDTVQDVARLGVQTGSNVIEFGETLVLRYLNGAGS